MKEKESISRNEFWRNVVVSLKKKQSEIKEDYRKAMKDYPDVMITQELTIGYLGHLLDIAIKRNAAGLDFPPDIDRHIIDDLLCRGGNPCMCAWREPATHKECFREGPGKGFGGIKVFPLKTCEDLISEYEEALKCYSNIPDNISVEEKVAMIQECDRKVSDANQALVDNGCMCDLLSKELDKALDCYVSAGSDPIKIQECQEKVNGILQLLSEYGCLD